MAKSLFSPFSRVGFPKEILSYHGSNFISHLFSELWKQLKSTPYHPGINSLVERFNGTLKSVKNVCQQKGEGLRCNVTLTCYYLFAYWAEPQDATGFAPFDLVYGRKNQRATRSHQRLLGRWH